mmetsp:Transcript_7494/g.31008  ORF Transcript_7494/g.31008 Transcript_7494/m.31008 type:complete len:216 (-) Transcript_7494:36-683(-)
MSSSGTRRPARSASSRRRAGRPPLGACTPRRGAARMSSCSAAPTSRAPCAPTPGRSTRPRGRGAASRQMMIIARVVRRRGRARAPRRSTKIRCWSRAARRAPATRSSRPPMSGRSTCPRAPGRGSSTTIPRGLLLRTSSCARSATPRRFPSSSARPFPQEEHKVEPPRGRPSSSTAGGDPSSRPMTTRSSLPSTTRRRRRCDFMSQFRLFLCPRV